jgi:hypothetical protein
METSISISDCFDSCESWFEKLTAALENPTRDFGDELPLPVVQEVRGKFRVWAGTVGAHHRPTSRLSLDYRLRESTSYLEQNLTMLRSLESTLSSGELAHTPRRFKVPNALLQPQNSFEG